MRVGRRVGGALLALVLAGCGVVSGGRPSGSPVARQHVTGAVPAPGSCRYRHAAGGELLPDPACTPGAVDPRVTQANVGSTICVRGYTRRVRPPREETDRAKAALMRAYGQSAPNELDHLIPLELGGGSDVRNLWPEPPPSPNAKDREEGLVFRVAPGAREVFDAVVRARLGDGDLAALRRASEAFWLWLGVS